MSCWVCPKSTKSMILKELIKKLGVRFNTHHSLTDALWLSMKTDKALNSFTLLSMTVLTVTKSPDMINACCDEGLFTFLIKSASKSMISTKRKHPQNIFNLKVHTYFHFLLKSWKLRAKDLGLLNFLSNHKMLLWVKWDEFWENLNLKPTSDPPHWRQSQQIHKQKF